MTNEREDKVRKIVKWIIHNGILANTKNDKEKIIELAMPKLLSLFPQPKQDETVGLLKELTNLLNRVSRENKSNTPDFILAEFMMSCLIAGEILIKTREKWYGKYMSIKKEKSI